VPRSCLLEILNAFFPICDTEKTHSLPFRVALFSKNQSKTYNNHKQGKSTCNFAAPTGPNNSGRTRKQFPAPLSASHGRFVNPLGLPDDSLHLAVT